MHYTTGEILSVCGSHGSMHDFKIFKKSMRKLKFKPFFIVDKGYLGIKKLGFGCLMPSKELGIPQSSISLCANGLRKKAGNFIWKYGKMDNSGEENLPK